MIRARIVVALALALAAAPFATGCSTSSNATTTPHGDTLTLPVAARIVGLRWTKTEDTTSSLRFGDGAGARQVDSKAHHVTETEILAVDAAGLMTKVKVGYPARTEVTVGGGIDMPSPLAGNTYIVGLDGVRIVATHADGSPVGAVELDHLTKDLDSDLGQPPAMEHIMAGHAWKVGARVDLDAGELARLAEVEGSNSAKVTTFSLTLQDTQGGSGTFAMTMTMGAPHGTFVIDASGKVVVDLATGRPLRLEVHGLVTGDAAGLAISGEMSRLSIYEFAK